MVHCEAFQKEVPMRFSLFAAFALVVLPLAAKTLHVYVLTGQSNSLGAIKGNPAAPARMFPAPERFRFWQANFGGYNRVEPPHIPHWEKVRPQRAAQEVMGPEYGFAQAMEAADPWPGDGLALVKASRDGGGNSHWQPGGGAYTAVTNAVASALAAVPKGAFEKIRLEALLYLQGESDKGAEVTAAPERFSSLLSNLRRDLPVLTGADASAMKAILGEPAHWHGRDTTVRGATTRNGLKALADVREDIGWVPTRDLPKIPKGDAMGVHYDGDAQLTIGRRFAAEALRLRAR